MNTFIEEDVQEPVPLHLQPRQKRTVRAIRRSEITEANSRFVDGFAQVLAHHQDTFGSLDNYAAEMRKLEAHGKAEHARLLAYAKANGLPIHPALKNGPEGTGRAPSMTAKRVMVCECYGVFPRNLRWLEPHQRISDTEKANVMDYFTRQQAVAKARAAQGAN